MNAVLAIIADGGHANVVIYREDFFYTKPFDGGLVQPLPKRLLGVGYVHPWKP